MNYNYIYNEDTKLYSILKISFNISLYESNITIYSVDEFKLYLRNIKLNKILNE